MELEYTDKVAIIYETLKNIETAILRLQERTKEVKSVDDMLLFIRSKSRDSMIYFRSNTTILFVNTILLFINTTGGMKNLPVVLFNMSIRMHVGYEARGSKGRRYGLHALWGLSLRPLGIVPLPPKECLASPIGDIGVPP